MNIFEKLIEDVRKTLPWATVQIVSTPHKGQEFGVARAKNEELLAVIVEDTTLGYSWVSIRKVTRGRDQTIRVITDTDTRKLSTKLFTRLIKQNRKKRTERIITILKKPQTVKCSQLIFQRLKTYPFFLVQVIVSFVMSLNCL